MNKIATTGILLLLASRCWSQTAEIDFSNLKQEIDGFGASSAGHGLLNSRELDAAFSNSASNQMGLSILRVEVTAWGLDSWLVERTNAQEAKKRGAKYVMASCWSGPASMKTNGNVAKGSLKESSYADYAAYLKSYREYMGNALDIVSIQNEPNVKVDYISCDWTPTQLYDFVKNNASSIGGDVMMPETFNYDVSYSDPVLNDAAAAKNITHIGLHLYGAQMKAYVNAVNKGKKVWMTEHFFNGDDIGTALTSAKEIMDCLNNQMNAYVWWYLRVPSCNLIDSTGKLLLKGYAMAHFSKYVRPGSHRVAATYSPQSGVTVLAFTGERDVVVILNQATTAKSQTLKFAKGTFTGVRRYTTSGSKRMSDDGAVTLNGGTTTLQLDAQSITTLVGVSSTAIQEGSIVSSSIRRLGSRIETSAHQLALYDTRGRLIRSANVPDGPAALDVSGLPEGIYVATDGSTQAKVSATESRR